MSTALLAAGCGGESTATQPEAVFARSDATPGVAGLGSLGTGAPTAGANRQDFDFDVGVDLSGRVFFRDWAVDANLDLDVDADAGTQITAFRDESALCTDPTRGAEVDGTGRLSTGGYVAFTLVACDDGAGAGTDALSLTFVTGYRRSGFLSSGDIVKETAAPPPRTGDLTVTTSTSGPDQPSGYSMSLDGGQGQPIGTSGTVTLAELAAGSHTVELSGVPANCTVSGGSSRSANVPAGGTGMATFSVTCLAALGTDALRVTTSTSGSNQPSGYTVSVDGGEGQPIGTNGTVTFALAAGDHTVELSGVPANCTVSGGTSRPVDVPAGGTATVTYSVSCAAPPPTTGDVTVRTTTSGSNLPSGYTVSVDGGEGQAIGTNGTVTFASLAAGDHTVELSGVAANCTVSGGTSRPVVVPAGGTATVTYSVSCAAP